MSLRSMWLTSSFSVLLSLPMRRYVMFFSHVADGGRTVRHASALLPFFTRFRWPSDDPSASSTVSSSAARPVSPPGPPPHRGACAHHFPSPGISSSFPSLARFCASIKIKPVSRRRSRISVFPSPAFSSALRKHV